MTVTLSSPSAASRMVDSIKGVKRIAAKLAHFDGAYLRFAGDIEIFRFTEVT